MVKLVTASGLLDPDGYLRGGGEVDLGRVPTRGRHRCVKTPSRVTLTQ